MYNETDILNQRNDASHVLDLKIIEAINIKNGLRLDDPDRQSLSDVINDLMASRTQLAIQALKTGLSSNELAAALAAIAKATADLKTEAATMTSATSFISNANTVIGAASKVTGVLKNGV